MKKQAFGDALIYRYDDHIVHVAFVENWDGPDDIETARQVVEGARALIGTDRPRALLVTSAKLYKKKEVMEYYQHTDVNGVAVGLLISSFAAKVMGNLYLRIARNKPNVKGRITPLKLFTEEAAAVAWLRKEVAAVRQQGAAK
jgi:hypothetical protein